MLFRSTRTAALLMGIADDRGSIEVGKRADLVVADGDVLDITDLGARVRTVVQHGREVAAGRPQ